MKISILGGSTTRFGELWSLSLHDLANEAINKALADSNLESKDIEALYVGNMLSGMLSHQENLGAFFSDVVGNNVPAFHVEGACASGGLALHSAIQSVLSGTYETVAVLGIEKMTDQLQDEVAALLMSASSEEERESGATFAGLYALMANAYLSKYKLSADDLVEVGVKNHYHGSLNKKAQFQKAVTRERALASPLIVDPLRLFDCSSISDGASAIVITSKTVDKSIMPVEILTSEVATDTLGLQDRSSLTTLKAVELAASRAYKKAGVKPEDIDVAELHDCFSIAEVLAIEDMGFSKRGEALRDIKSGFFTLGGKKTIINSSGGLKACGHPVGATGIKQIVELTDQLRGKAEGRQVTDARIGLAHNVGGTGAVAAIHILSI